MLNFHLNHVGYKGGWVVEHPIKFINFHLNHVGYKGFRQFSKVSQGCVLSSEPCGI